MSCKQTNQSTNPTTVVTFPPKTISLLLSLSCKIDEKNNKCKRFDNKNHNVKYDFHIHEWLDDIPYNNYHYLTFNICKKHILFKQKNIKNK